MSNPEILEQSATRPNRKNLRRVPVKAIAVGTAAVFGLVGVATVADKLGFDLGGFGMSTKTEIEQPKVIVRKIKPIDIGCFVEVDASTELKAHEHKRTDIGPIHKTWWTNSTTANNEGMGRLCVDNTNSKVFLETNTSTGVKTLDVKIGSLYTEGFIVHNGHDGAKTDRALGQRVGELFGGDGNRDIKGGLDLVAQTLFQQTPCVKDAIPVAEKSINRHYAELANTISEGTITNVNVTFNSVPAKVDFPTGRINKQLEHMGVSIPDNWGIDSKAPLCSVAEIGGKPAIAS